MFNSFFFADGRDTPPKSCIQYIKQLQQENLQIASIIGRYYAMDRDNNQDRIELAYQMLINGQTQAKSSNLIQTVQQHYNELNETDEFLTPILNEQCYQAIQSDDVLVFIDFRADRMRQIVQHFLSNQYQNLITMTSYSAQISNQVAKILFPKQNMENVLSQWLAKHNLKQLHTAETEKYAHVTFF